MDTNVASAIPLPDCVLDAVRSIDGVRYAVPLYSGGALLKLRDGTYRPATCSGCTTPAVKRQYALTRAGAWSYDIGVSSSSMRR